MKTHRSDARVWMMMLAGLLGSTIQLCGHGEEPARAPAEGTGENPVLIEGIGEFMEGIRDQGRNQFTQEQLTRLGEVEQHLHFAEEILGNKLSGYTQRDGLYHQGQAQRKLLHLLDHNLADLIVMDFRNGGNGHDVMRPVELPALKGAIFLKVVIGDGPSEFSVQNVNLKREYWKGPYNLVVRDGGTSYILMDLSEIPSSMNRLIVTFSTKEQPDRKYWSGLTIDSPETGQFKMEVLDENGDVTPALIRLVNQASGTLWAPPNAVDVWPIMTGIRGFPQTTTIQPYEHFFMSGMLRGHYWIVPGPFEMALPEGKWDLYILHGIEYEPVITSFEVVAGEWTSRQINLDRWVDMPGRGWYSGDDHVHARMMSSQDARDIMAFVRAADIKVANILEMGDAARTYYAQRGFGDLYRVEEDGYILVPGQEDPRSEFGHVIGMNLTALARDLEKYYLNDWVADEIHRQGGLYGHTHVGEGYLGVHRDMTMLLPRGKSDFSSIMQNILGTDLYYEFLNLGFKLTASAGSDTPYGGAVGITRVYAFIGEDKPFSADAWFDAFGKGHTFVTNGPMLEMRVDDALPGDEIVMTTPRPVRVVAKSWGLKGYSAPVKFQLIKNGVTIKELQPAMPGQNELSINMEVDPGNGCWIAVAAVGADGTQAHTTPVYITRKGFRHWNREQAYSLIDKRMETLDEIETMVRTQLEKQATGNINPLDFGSQLMAGQAPEILKRTRLVRALYETLQLTLEKELHAAD